MPKVPTYDGSQAQSRALSGGAQDSVASPGLFDASAVRTEQMGKQLVAGGAALGEVAAKMQERQNADMLFRAETSIKTDYLDFETQARERKGQSAWGLTQDAKKWWDDAAKKGQEGLENDVQRKLFMQQMEKLRIQSLETMSKHETEQRRISIGESAQASIVGSINLAAANADQPEAISAAKGDVLKRVQVLAQINGWSDQIRTAKEAEYLTNLHSQVIQNLADKQPMKAKEYFEANKKEINGSVHEQIDKLLKTGGTKITAQRFADEVDASGMTEADAIKAARGKFEGEDEAAAVLEIKTRFAERTQARERMQKDAGDQAWAIYGRTKNINNIPSTVLNAMDGRDLASLRQHAENSIKQKNPKTDPELYYDLRKMHRDKPDEFAKLNLRHFMNGLSPGDFQEFVKLQTGKPEATDIETNINRQFTITFRTLGWKESNDKQKMGEFEAITRKAISDEEKRLGKKLDDDGRQKIIDKMIIEGDTNGPWYKGGIGGGRKFYEVQGTPDAEKFVPEVPKKDRQQIEAELVKRGKKVTEEEVLRIYKKAKGF